MSLVFNSSFDPFRGFELLPANAARKPASPAYDLVANSEDSYSLTVAVPGYTESELTVTVDDGSLIIRGEPVPANAEGAKDARWIRRGISRGTFEQRFALGEHVQVKSADLSHGLLQIQLERVVPEALKPRTIAIGAGQPTAGVLSSAA